MTDAQSAPAARPDGAHGPAPLDASIGGYVDRFFGTPGTTAQDRVQTAKAGLTAAGGNIAAAAKAHPLLSLLALAGGVVAIGLLANPVTRKPAIAGGLALWRRLGPGLSIAP
jgi:hypothetical protein